MAKPLKYRISNWNQLASCKSNNSADLYITVSQVFNDDRANCTVITINHNDFGVMFACTVGCSGTLFTEDPNSEIIAEFTTDQILVELHKFGFDVEFILEKNLSGEQISYLMTLSELGFDKIRQLDVFEYDTNANRHYSRYIVAFDVERCPKWINQSYAEHKSQFLEALSSGGATNLTYISKTQEFDWNWLTYVASIDDIIRNNG